MTSQDTQPAERFGTFLGVYTPSVLTILGLIMYLRFGWVVGNLGLAESIFTLLPEESASPRAVQLVAAATVVVITAVAGKSAGAALRLQIPIVVLVGLSLAALASTPRPR